MSRQINLLCCEKSSGTVGKNAYKITPSVFSNYGRSVSLPVCDGNVNRLALWQDRQDIGTLSNIYQYYGIELWIAFVKKINIFVYIYQKLN